MGRCAFLVAAFEPGLSVERLVILECIEADLNSHQGEGASSVRVVVGRLELAVRPVERELAVPGKGRLPGASELVEGSMEWSEWGTGLAVPSDLVPVMLAL